MSHSPTATTATTVRIDDPRGLPLRVDPALDEALRADLGDGLEGEYARIARLYSNDLDEDELPLATLDDIRVPPGPGTGPLDVLDMVGELALGAAVEDPAYYDTASYGPLPAEPYVDGDGGALLRYVIAGRRVWLDQDLGSSIAAQAWLVAADPAAHAALNRALYPSHPRKISYQTPAAS